MKYLRIGFFLALAGQGCGGGDSTPTDASTRTDTGPGTDAGTDTGPSTQCDPNGAAVNLAGTWAIKASLAVELTQRSGGLVQLCPNPQTVPATLFFLEHITGSGNTVMQDVQVCQVGLPQARGSAGDCSGMPLTIRLTPSPALTNYLPSFHIPTITTTLSSTRPCAPYAPQPFTVLLGVNPTALMNPETDPLPAWCSPCNGMGATQCICRDCMHTGADCVSRAMDGMDSDGDMHPGVTVQVASSDPGMTIRGEAYLAFRTRPHLSGTIRNANRIAGSLEAPLEYALLGSDVTLGAAVDTAAVVSALPNFRFLTEGSEFVMLRSDGDQTSMWDADGNGTITCADVLARQNNFNR